MRKRTGGRSLVSELEVMDELLARAIKAYYVARRREGTIADQPNISNSGTETQRQALYRAPQQQGNTGGLPCSPPWGSEGTQTVAADFEYLVTSRPRASRRRISGGRRSAGRSSNSVLHSSSPPALFEGLQAVAQYGSGEA